MASLDDILTTQKNGVVAINSISTALAGLYAYVKGLPLTRAPAATGTYASLYVVPTGKQLTLTDIEICNTGTTAATFYVSLVPQGGTAGAGNALFYAAPISPKMTVQWTGQQIIASGGSVQAYASSADVTIMISGSPGQ